MNEDLEYKLLHLGINADDSTDATQIARILEIMFGFPARTTSTNGYFCGPFEIMGGNGRGRHGHIAIGTTDIVKAVERLQSCGFQIDEDSYRYNADGRPTFVYLLDEVAGFAIHLLSDR